MRKQFYQTALGSCFGQFEITKMLIAVIKKIIYRVSYYNFWHTFVPCGVLFYRTFSQLLDVKKFRSGTSSVASAVND